MICALVPRTDVPCVDAKALNDRVRGAYLGLAVGDALGASVEFMLPHEIKANMGVHRNIVGGGWLHLKAGHVTDDTEMSLALGEAILADGGFSALGIARVFDAWLKSKPIDVGHTVRRAIVRFRSQGLTQMPLDDYDAGNGAVMRALPVAIATLGACPDDVARAAKLQAHVTHNAPLADLGLMAVVRMTQCALRGKEDAFLEMGRIAQGLREQAREYDFTKRRMENPSAFLPETLRAVFQAFLETDTFEAALIDVVNRGGDADTTGAILGFMVGALHGESAIPERWLKGLNAEVRKRCKRQALSLLQMSPMIGGDAVSFMDA